MKRTFTVEYDSGVAAAERMMPRAELTRVEPFPLVATSNRDDFETNRVTLAAYSDSREMNTHGVLGLATAWACVNLNAGTIGSLPIQVLRAGKGGVEEEEWDHQLYRVVSESPNADQSPLDFFEYCAASIELQGNAYAQVDRGSNGRVIALDVPIPPDRMTVRRADNGDIQYEWYDGGRQRATQRDMLHIRGFGGSPLGGLSTLSYGRMTFGLAQSIERAAASTFRNGMNPSGVMSVAKQLKPEERAEAERLLQQKYMGAARTGVPLLLDNGVDWKSISINPDDAQMLESRSLSVEEICRFFGTPPHMIGHTAGNTHLGSSIEQQTLAWIIFSMRRRLKRFEQAMQKQLLTPADRARGLKIRFDLRGLMRGDSKARAEFYQMALQNGWMTINEVRALEGLPPVEGGDVIRLQMQNVPINQNMSPENAA